MPPEILTILGVGGSTHGRLGRLCPTNRKRFEQLEPRQARLEGLLDGLREALFERAARV